MILTFERPTPAAIATSLLRRLPAEALADALRVAQDDPTPKGRQEARLLRREVLRRGARLETESNLLAPQ